jgi:hypothetical protein
MKVGKLEIQNFKSIRKLELSCKRINIFIGEPNTGKSNILEAIGLLSHICYGKLGNFVRIENMTDLFYDHVLEETIEIGFDENGLTVEFTDGQFLGSYNNIHKAHVKPGEITVGSKAFKYSYNGEGMNWAQDEPGERWSTLSSFKFYRYAKQSAFPNRKSDFLQPPNGGNLLAVILTRKELRNILKEIFGKFGYRLVFRPQEGKIEVQKEFEDIIISFPYSLSSETLQRIVFHLTAIYSNKESVITFEEPEAHAFPYYTKYLAERIAMDTNNNQYFVATHNPYFLMSILEKTPKNEVATFLTYIEDYQTKVKTLSEKEKEEILHMGTDVFFNVEKFLGKRK